MGRTEFLTWLSKTKVRWHLTNDGWEHKPTFLRCQKGHCPLQVLTRSYNYETLAQTKHGMTKRLVASIINAADSRRLTPLRKDMLKAVGLR